MITTTGAAAYLYVFGIETPLSLTDPLKILGNLSGIALFIGCTLVVANRLRGGSDSDNSTYYDWLFLAVLYLTTITGILSELTRLADVASLAYPLYAVHLVFIFLLIAYTPYSKFAHLFYRFVAIVHSKHSGREAPLPSDTII